MIPNERTGDRLIYDSYLAHIAADNRQELVQDHLKNVAEMTAQFAKVFDAENIGYFTGLVHDIGKYSDAFQERIRGANIHVDHSTYGAWLCANHNLFSAIFCVAGHHAGLPDLGSKFDTVDAVSVNGRLNRCKRQLIPDCSHWQTEIQLPKASEPSWLANDALDMMFFIRMLYSCLVDADYLCTEQFMQDCGRNSQAKSMADLTSILDAYTAGFYPAQTQLNQLRCDILDECKSAGQQSDRGLFTLSVPTGGGKTVSSLSFALHQAKTYGLSRVIYVVPYMSIIEQNAAVFQSILGEDQVLEHHFGISYEITSEASPLLIQKANATENWDMPIVVTTAVQFFESLFAARSSKCRKLHNIANSVVIFDEAQMLPLHYLYPCVYAMAELVKHYACSVVLCTATQPALGPIFQQYLPDMSMQELCPMHVQTDLVFKRVQYRDIGKQSWADIAAQMTQRQQALCVVNSRKNAASLYEELPAAGRYYLSTYMCPMHRKTVLAEIMGRLEQGLPCWVVSTSLIEAGVDIDFPVVFREEAGLDSILQSGGRCNRHGIRPLSDSFVFIFSAENRPPMGFQKAIHAYRETQRKFDDVSSVEAVAFYFHELLVLNGESTLDQKSIIPLMKSSRFPFREIAEKVNLIDSDTRTVYIPYDQDAERDINALVNGNCSRGLIRRLGKYGVSVMIREFDTLCKTKVITLLDDGQTGILADMQYYTQGQGLALSVTTR